MQMLYGYHQAPKTIDILRQELQTTTIGTYAPQLGLHLLQNGFKVSIINHNPKLVTVEDRDKSSKELIEQFAKRLQTADLTENDKMIMRMFIDFLQKGGNLVVKIPSAEDISREITHKRPLIALLQNGAWYTRSADRPFSDIFHMVVVTGLDDKFIYFNDPHAQHGGSSKSTHTEFFYALYSSALADPDNASLITVEKT